jgi:MFS transporter, ACS family, tartrate transporter
VGSAVEEVDQGHLDRAVARARRRLIPFLFLLFIVAYLDRINVGFASLQMNDALGFSSTTFGLGASIFFLSYALFEIPSNIMLARVGARLWIARIMISWGVVSSAMMFVTSAPMFYALRLLLGATEAGFFPGIIYYLTRWFPARDRAKAVAGFMTSVLIAGVVGGPISGSLLRLDGAAGLAGWQWLFLVEGLPAIVLGIVVLFVLVETPAEATWLPPAERTALCAALAREQHQPGRADALAPLLRAPRTWLLAAVYFTIPVTLYGVGFWLPQMVKRASGASDLTVGLLTTIPYAVGAVAMVIVSRRSDRVGERRFHVLVPAIVSASALVLSTLGTGTVWIVATLSLATAGYASMFGPFWALATASMRGVGAAAAIALINSLGNTGGFVGPYLLGAINDRTHSFAIGFYAIAAMIVAGAALVLFVDDRR